MSSRNTAATLRGAAKLRRGVLTLAAAAANSLRPPPAVPDPPLVSVVIATYNWSSVLRHAIASVRSQRYPNWELIVVGDACTDDSGEVVASFGDERIRWHNRDENSGSQSLPNNDGVALARGDFVAYHGHDDIWAPDHLLRGVATLRRRRADVAFALTEIIGPAGSGVRSLGGMTPDGGYAGGHIPPTAVVHRTAMAAEIGGWRDYREIDDPPDMEFWVRALAAGNRFACTWALTAFKFPSAMRRNSYVEKPSWEQEALARRMRAERVFTLRELARLSVARLLHSESEIEGYDLASAQGSKGAQVKAARRIRGLDP